MYSKELIEMENLKLVALNSLFLIKFWNFKFYLEFLYENAIQSRK